MVTAIQYYFLVLSFIALLLLGGACIELQDYVSKKRKEGMSIKK